MIDSQSLAAALRARWHCHRRAFAVAVAAMVTLMVLDTLLTWRATPADPALRALQHAVATPTDAGRAAVALVSVVGPIAFAVAGGFITGGPFAWRTSGAEVVENGRTAFVATRIILLAATGLGTLVLMWLVRAGLAVVLPSPASGGSSHVTFPGKGSFGHLLLGAGIAWVGVVMWGTAALLVALLVRSRLAGLVVVAYAYVETLAPIPAPARQYLPASAQVATLAHVDFLPAGLTLLPGPALDDQAEPTALIVSVVWTAAIVLASLGMARRRRLD